MQYLGDFVIHSGTIRVTDPCYPKDTWGTRGLLDNAKKGAYHAYTVIGDEKCWGNRVRELIIVHVEHSPLYNVQWIKTDLDVGVDSGQAGFFDDHDYPDDDVGDYDDINSFYGTVCKLTLDENSAGQGGVIPWGAVSRSGFGDGSYDCYIAKDYDDIYAAKIVFISDADLDVEEDKEDEEEV